MEVYAIGLLIVAFVAFLLRDEIGDAAFFPIEFILITISGAIAYPWKDSHTTWDIFVSFGGGATLALSFLALLGYLDYIRQNEQIEIFFKLEGEKNILSTGLKVLRKNATRAEMQGLLRILANGNGYRLSSLFESDDVLKEVDKIQTGKNKQIIIDIKEEEIDKFPNIPDYQNIIKKLNNNINNK